LARLVAENFPVAEFPLPLLRSLFISSRRALIVPVVYLEEHRQAKETRRLVGNQNRKCLLIASDIGVEELRAPSPARSEGEHVCLGKIKATLVDEARASTTAQQRQQNQTRRAIFRRLALNLRAHGRAEN